MNENGEPVRVLDTREKAGAIYHVTDKAIPEGTEVLGRLNWDKRLRNMQNHSGEHILSGLIHAKYGYNNVGFHMGSDAVTLDLDGVIVPEELPEFERQVNEVIEKNVEIEILYPSREELEKIDYRSKKEIRRSGADRTDRHLRYLRLLRNPCGVYRRDPSGKALGNPEL